MGSLSVKVLVASRSPPGVDQIAERVEFSLMLFQRPGLTLFTSKLLFKYWVVIYSFGGIQFICT